VDHLTLRNVKGDTADDETNASHLDVVQLSTYKLYLLSQIIGFEAEKERVPWKTVHKLLVANISAKHIEKSKIKILPSEKIWNEIK
jgi:hypothetical protein